MPVQNNVTRSTILLLTIVAVVGANSLSLGPIAPGIATDLSTTVGAILRASAAYGIGTALSAFFLAPYIDRYGVRLCLLIATALLSVSLLFSAGSHSAAALTVAQLFAGFAAGVALPACYACVPLIAAPHQQSKVMGIVLTGWTLSMVIGVGLSAYAADYIHWRSVYVVFAIVAGVITVSIVHSTLPVQKSATPKFAQISVIRIPGVALLLCVVTCYMVSFYGLYNYLGVHVVDTLSRSLSANAWISILYGIGFGIAALVDPLLDTWTARKQKNAYLPVLAMLVLAVVYLMLSTVAHHYFVLLAMCLLWGLVNHVVLNILLSVLNQVDRDRRGSILGLYSCVTYLSLSVGTLFYGLIYQRSTVAVLGLVSAFMCASGAAMLTRYKTHQ